MHEMDSNKICFIACVNDEFLYNESLMYIEQLYVPEGMSVELVAVHDAESMAAGYQAAMEASDARYKVYMHQDVFIVNPYIISDIVSIFESSPKIGMIGVVGAAELNSVEPIWWESQTKYGKAYNKKSSEEIQKDIYGEFSEPFRKVAVIDGIFMATQYDVSWRKDLFTDWHFYDISQSREFYRKRYQVVVANQKEPWLVHACGRKMLDDVYRKNMEIFKQNYFEK